MIQPEGGGPQRSYDEIGRKMGGTTRASVAMLVNCLRNDGYLEPSIGRGCKRCLVITPKGLAAIEGKEPPVEVGAGLRPERRTEVVSIAQFVVAQLTREEQKTLALKILNGLVL